MNASLQLSARVIGASFANDPELELPSFPRFPTEIMVLPYHRHGLLFEGAHSTQVINGRGARGFLPRLIAVLDGTRRPSDVVAAFPEMPERAVWDALTLLYSRGLLEDAGQGDCGASDMLSFFGRYADVTRVNRNRHEAGARLAASRIALAGSPGMAALLAEALGGQGIGSIQHIDAGAADDVPDLLIGAFAPDDPSVAGIMAKAWARRIPALHACIGRDSVEIGPIFMPGQSACYRCLREIHPGEPLQAPAADLGFWAGVLALGGHHTLSRIGNPSLYNSCHLHTRDAAGPSVEVVRIARLPGCPICGLGGRRPIAHDPRHTIWRLHNAANTMPPTQFHNPRDYQAHYAAVNIQITKQEADHWYGAVPVALPAPAALVGPPAWAKQVSRRDLDLRSLASLLRLAGGTHPGSARRYAPSAGGLGTPELFLAVRDVAGLVPSVYRYDPAAHRLDRLRTVPDELLAGALGVPREALPRIVLIGTANTSKLQQKYGDFTFRFANLDAGVVRLYLHDVAAALGLAVTEYPHARDAVLADAMSIPSVAGSYLVTFAMGLGADTAAGRDRIRFDDFSAQLAERSTSPAVEPPPQRPSPICEVTATDLGALLQARASHREFALRDISLGIVRHIAALACQANDALAGIGAPAVHMRVWACLNESEEQPGAVYSFDPDQRQLHLLRTGLRPKDVERLVLQRALARAPLVLLITGDFEHAASTHGARGYREIISRAGAMAARALVAAVAEGLQGCPWGGLTEDGWATLLPIDRYQDCPLFGVSLGYIRHDR